MKRSGDFEIMLVGFGRAGEITGMEMGHEALILVFCAQYALRFQCSLITGPLETVVTQPRIAACRRH